jgi:hypothetical protein
MATLGERGPSRPGSDHRADGDRRSLKVRVQYRGGGRARAGSEFRLSADDLSLWFRGPQVPPEFVERDGAGAANGVRDRLRRGREGLMARAGLKGTTA